MSYLCHEDGGCVIIHRLLHYNPPEAPQGFGVRNEGEACAVVAVGVCNWAGALAWDPEGGDVERCEGRGGERRASVTGAIKEE